MQPSLTEKDAGIDLLKKANKAKTTVHYDTITRSSLDGNGL